MKTHEREESVSQVHTSYEPVIHCRAIADLLSKLNKTSRHLQSPHVFDFGRRRSPTVQAIDPPNDGRSITD